ncbi:MAG TPA: fumarylacetoacetate hydrolase family protein [Candidatus Eremiobacteraceae bacterium]|jgi:2-keto-4-pentenoate hydratase/2-oxohepta-3-ene-1,7-dioic acid hydratase in catechol pathway|nr:fumarylacetoacetate hydrolase family protein [Candidatus Eremiobacteraceae bacterium]
MSLVRKIARCLVSGTVRDGTIVDSEFIFDGGRIALDRATMLAPCLPSKIIGVGRNYAEHAAEMNNPLPTEPLLFLKPASALNHHDGDVVYPAQSRHVDYEGELAVIIGTACKNVSRADASTVILGYTICNDFTARDLQRTDGQWARAKGFDGFAPLGPCIVTGIDPSSLRVRTYLNGVLKQDGSTSSLIFDIPSLIEYISAAFTLEPGDVITTGTPAGVSPVHLGDVVEVSIDQIGVLRNRIVAP